MMEKITDTTFANSPFLFPSCNSYNHTNGDSVNYGQAEAQDDREINKKNAFLCRSGSFLDLRVAHLMSWDNFWPMDLSYTGCSYGFSLY